MAGPSEREKQIGERLREMMQRTEDQVSLAEAALLIAACEYPGLDGQRYIRRLDEMAAAVVRHVPQERSPFDVIAGINRYLLSRRDFPAIATITTIRGTVS
jgi:regulator of sirC expression with transglutaminase-like and TPR domain